MELLRHQYHNNFFIGNGLDVMSGKQNGNRFNHNVFLEGAQKNKHQDRESIVEEVSTKFNFQKGSHPQTINFNAGEKFFEKLYPLITSEYVGELTVPKMAMENPDGTLLDKTQTILAIQLLQKTFCPDHFRISKKEVIYLRFGPKEINKLKIEKL